MIDQVAEPDPPEVAHFLAEYKGALAFDIGANVGQSAKVLARNFEQVVSVEPCQESFEVMTNDPAFPGNVEVVFAACSAELGVVTLYEQERHLAKGQLTTRQDEHTTPEDEVHGWGKVMGTREVRATTIDNMVDVYGIPDMIKCDVEGHEVKVFEGAKRLLESEAPDLWIEVHNAEAGDTLRRMLWPQYGSTLAVIRHPHYGRGSWGWSNHWWLYACADASEAPDA